MGAEKVFTWLVKNEGGAPASELVPDNDIAAFIGLDRLINFIHIHRKLQIVPVSST